MSHEASSGEDIPNDFACGMYDNMSFGEIIAKLTVQL